MLNVRIAHCRIQVIIKEVEMWNPQQEWSLSAMFF